MDNKKKLPTTYSHTPCPICRHFLGLKMQYQTTSCGTLQLFTNSHSLLILLLFNKKNISYINAAAKGKKKQKGEKIYATYM